MYKNYLFNKSLFLKLNQSGGYIDNTNIKKIYSILKQLDETSQNRLLTNFASIKEHLSITNEEVLDEKLFEQVVKVSKEDEKKGIFFPNLLPLVTNFNSINGKLTLFTKIYDDTLIQINDVVDGIRMIINNELMLEEFESGKDYKIITPSKILVIGDEYTFESIKGNIEYNFKRYINDSSLVQVISSLFKNYTILKTMKENMGDAFHEYSDYHKYINYKTFLSQFFNYRIESNTIKPHKMNIILSTFILMNNINLLFDLLLEPLNNMVDVQYKLSKHIDDKKRDQKQDPKVRQLDEKAVESVELEEPELERVPRLAKAAKPKSMNKITKQYSLKKISDSIYSNFKKKIEKLIPKEKVIHLYNHVIQANINVLYNIDISNDSSFRYYTDRVLLNEKNLYELFIYELYNFINIYQTISIHSYRDKIPDFCKDIIYYYLTKTYITSNTLKNKFLFIDLLNNISIEERIQFENSTSTRKDIFDDITNIFLSKHVDDPAGFKIIEYNSIRGIAYDGSDYGLCVETALINIINYVLPRNEDDKLILPPMQQDLASLYNGIDNFPMVDEKYVNNINSFINILSDNIPNVTYRINNSRNRKKYNIIATENNLYNCLLYLFPNIPENVDSLDKLLKHLNDTYEYTWSDNHDNLIINNKYTILIYNDQHIEFKYYNTYEVAYYTQYNKSINNLFIAFNKYTPDIINNFINFINMDNTDNNIKIKNKLFNDLNNLVPYNENLLNDFEAHNNNDLKFIHMTYDSIDLNYPFLINLVRRIDYTINNNKLHNIFAIYIITYIYFENDLELEKLIIASNLKDFLYNVFISDFMFFNKVSLIEYSIFFRTDIISTYILSTDTEYKINLFKSSRQYTSIHTLLGEIFTSELLELFKLFLSYYAHNKCLEEKLDCTNSSVIKNIIAEKKIYIYADDINRVIDPVNRDNYIMSYILVQGMIWNTTNDIHRYLMNYLYKVDDGSIQIPNNIKTTILSIRTIIANS